MDPYQKDNNFDNNDYPKTIKKSDIHNLILYDDPKGYLLYVGLID